MRILSLNNADLARGLYTTVVSQSVEIESLASVFVDLYVEHGEVRRWILKLCDLVSREE